MQSNGAAGNPASAHSPHLTRLDSPCGTRLPRSDWPLLDPEARASLYKCSCIVVLVVEKRHCHNGNALPWLSVSQDTNKPSMNCQEDRSLLRRGEHKLRLEQPRHARHS